MIERTASKVRTLIDHGIASVSFMFASGGLLKTRRGINPVNRKRRGRKKNVVTLKWKPPIKFTKPISKKRQLEIDEENKERTQTFLAWLK